MNANVDVTAVRDFVAAVRAELSDLPPDELDELTAGLEGDLSAAIADGSSVAEGGWGSPASYAAELRAAAGLPPRSRPVEAPEEHPSLVARLSGSVRGWGESLLTRFPWLPELRATWWVTRGVIAGWVLSAILGVTSGAWLVMLVGAALSFALGRRQSGLDQGWRHLITAGNWLAAVLIVPCLVTLSTPRFVHVPDPSAEAPVAVGESGVWVNGEAATNLYAYGPDGKRIDGVRLFNQYGQGLALNGEAFLNAYGDPANVDASLEAMLSDGLVRTQVFPVRWAARSGWETSSGKWSPPVLIEPLAPQAPPSSSPAASPAPSPSSSGTPSATSPTPSGGSSAGASHAPSPTVTATP